MGSNGGGIYRIKSFKEKKELNSSFSLSPNPVKNRLIIQGNSLINSISVYNLSGKNVFYADKIKSEVQEIDLQKLDSGIYFIKIEFFNGEVETKRLIKT
jgi:hypothetical protein